MNNLARITVCPFIPLDRPRQLRREIINDAVDALHLIDDAAVKFERSHLSSHSSPQAICERGKRIGELRRGFRRRQRNPEASHAGRWITLDPGMRRRIGIVGGGQRRDKLGADLRPCPPRIFKRITRRCFGPGRPCDRRPAQTDVQHSSR